MKYFYAIETNCGKMIYATALKTKLVQARGSGHDVLLCDTLYRAIGLIT